MFGWKKKEIQKISYDPAEKIPVIRSSICTGEQVGCLKDRHTGKLEEIMLIRDDRDLEAFRAQYGIEGPIQEVY